MNNYEEEAFDGVYEEFFAYLDGNAPRPDLSTVPANIAAELEAIEISEQAGRNVDFEMIPDFESDPVAIRLGFRSGAEEQRVSGGALAHARTRQGLSVKELADLTTAQGTTVTPSDIASLEDQAWSTTASNIVAELARVLAIDEADLRIRRPTLSETVTDRLLGLGLPLTLDDDTDPVIDSVTGDSKRLVVAYLDLRVRTVLLADVDADHVADREHLRTAQLILRIAGDTSAVALVSGDADATTQIIEPADVSTAVSVPSGRRLWFVPARPPMAIELAFNQFFERLVPQWDALETDTASVIGTDSLGDLVTPLAERSVASASAKKFKIAEKKLAYSSLDSRDVNAIAALISTIAAGHDTDDLFLRLDEMAELAP
jgi:hypothetical protein